MTPTQRTIKALRADGWTADRVDCTNRMASHDFLGIIDVIALRGAEVLAVQVTGGYNGLARVHKMEAANEEMAAMREAGWSIEVHDWRKLKAGWDCRKWDLS
ncbi:MAG: hypothetical protein AAGA95_10560 [Pseudomonadota bacterium]